MKYRIMKNILVGLIGCFCVTFLQAAELLPPGYPNRNSNFDVLPGFVNPPKGYGEVPFYWWLGDTLTQERILWHLDELSEKKVSSIQVNYAHSDDGKWLKWGLTYPSKPALFSDKWWELFGWFMREAKKRGMSVSLSDYTLGVASGYCLDAAKRDYPDLEASRLRYYEFVYDDVVGRNIDNFLLLNAYQTDDSGKMRLDTKIDLKDRVKNHRLLWKPENKEKWKILMVCSEKCKDSYDPMHPMSGKAYIRHFFQKFEDMFPEDADGGLNFFFSDELEFNIKGNMWNDNFAKEFKQRKGYDIVPFLSGLFVDIGPMTDKIRLDYNDVAVSLSEENYFKPIYDWHQQRGLIFGCDHGGRGTRVADFGDYFRTQRWNQGPGCDQPFLGKDLIKNKVNASIAHMYERPRVWLEGFYGSGWGTTSFDLIDAIFANFAQGQNLLSLHGLYYATPGGMWEWAPPCNHFRMPYWQVMEPLLECTERLSFLLSQGYHVADVAILYPVEPVVAGKGNQSPNMAFDFARKLYDNAIDFDFIDYESFNRAVVVNSEIQVSGEKFKIIVVPSMITMKHSTLEKLIRFKQSGGIVINLGDIPVSTDKWGADMKKLQPYLNKYLSKEDKGQMVLFNQTDSAVQYVKNILLTDFSIISGNSEKPYYIHRRIGKRDVYAIYNVDKGTECRFRAIGDVEYWDAWTGKNYKLLPIKQDGTCTVVKLPKSKYDFQIIVFTDRSDAELLPPMLNVKEKVVLDTIWSCEFKPVLNNKYGDFNWPPTVDFIGPEVRRVKTENGNIETYSYGPVFYQYGPLKSKASPNELKIAFDSLNNLSTYRYSIKYGVEGDEGHQGFHGLKLQTYPELIRLGKLTRTMTTTKREEEEEGAFYYLMSFVHVPESGEYDVLVGNEKPCELYINGKVRPFENKIFLEQGLQQIVLAYEKPCITYFFFSKPGGTTSEDFLRTPWYRNTSILPFDIKGSSKRLEKFFFMSAPGLKSLTLKVAGELKVKIDGKNAEVVLRGKEGIYREYEVFPSSYSQVPSQVEIIAQTEEGYCGGAFFDEPIKQKTGLGKISLGDFARYEGMESYSGGLSYKQKINISEEQINRRVQLNLGDLSSAVEVFLNGESVGIKLFPEWVVDLTGKLRLGENELEIILYNTAANHFLTIPTRYRGNLKSGLYGPVVLEFE